MRTWSRKVLLALSSAAVVAGLAVAGVTLASNSSSEQATDGPTPPGQAPPSPPPSAMPAATAARLSVLRRPREPGDALPSEVAALRDDLAFIDGSDALSRKVSAPGPARWIVPGVNGVCLVQDRGRSYGHACGALAAVTAGRFVLVSDGGANRDMTVSGVVPDGVDGVVVRDGDGTRHDAAVSENSFSIDVPSGAAQIRWTAAGGASGGTDIPNIPEP